MVSTSSRAMRGLVSFVVLVVVVVLLTACASGSTPTTPSATPTASGPTTCPAADVRIVNGYTNAADGSHTTTPAAGPGYRTLRDQPAGQEIVRLTNGTHVCKLQAQGAWARYRVLDGEHAGKEGWGVQEYFRKP